MRTANLYFPLSTAELTEKLLISPVKQEGCQRFSSYIFSRGKLWYIWAMYSYTENAAIIRGIHLKGFLSTVMKRGPFQIYLLVIALQLSAKKCLRYLNMTPKTPYTLGYKHNQWRLNVNRVLNEWLTPGAFEFIKKNARGSKGEENICNEIVRKRQSARLARLWHEPFVNYVGGQHYTLGGDHAS